MDCPKCGVYNPEDRSVCWRCDRELPRPEPPKKRLTDSTQAARRMWIIVIVAMVVWAILTFVIPLLFGGSLPTP